MDKHGEQPSGPRLNTEHRTEFGDIPPSADAVFNPEGHIKNAYLKRYAEHLEDGSKSFPLNQSIEIMKHTDSCPDCKEELRKLRGGLPVGLLPFD